MLAIALGHVGQAPPLTNPMGSSISFPWPDFTVKLEPRGGEKPFLPNIKKVTFFVVLTQIESFDLLFLFDSEAHRGVENFQ